MNPTILLTFDVEDWFQVENLRSCFPLSSWASCPLRVENNVHKILDLLDSIKLNNHGSIITQQHRNTATPQHSNIATQQHCNTQISSKATFFILGWIAERLPHLVHEIKVRGHEVASHGYGHILCREQPLNELKEDLERSKKLLEDIVGQPVYGYRAPGFSISNDILSLIEAAGYLYDSSFNSFKLNRRYGQVELKTNHGNGILKKISDSFYEIPISNITIGRKFLPWGGGGYFRLYPFMLFKQGIQSILKKEGAYLFYIHPWEIDHKQPRISNIPISFKFRHYLNLHKTYSRLAHLLNTFRNCQFSTCFQYITSSTYNSLE